MANKSDFRFVLRRYDRNPNITLRVGGYDEVSNSVPVEIDGVVASTVFLNSENVFKRFIKLGWKDETQRYVTWTNKTERNESSNQVVEFAVETKPKPKKSGRKKKQTT